MADSWSSPETLVEWLQREKTVELIFGEGLHAQVVSRCVELLGFLAMQGALDGGHIELIWRASLDKHESVKQPIYQTLADLTAHLPPERQAQLYSHIKSVPFAEYTKDVLALLRGFAIGAAQSQAVAGVVPSPGEGYGLEELWGLMADGSPLGDELRASAEAALGEILTWIHGASHRGPYLQRCLRQLEAGTSVPQCLRLSRRILSSFPSKPPRKKGASETLASALELLAGEHNLLAVLFADLARYNERAAARFAARAAAASKAKSRRAAEAAAAATEREHLDELQERLDFLTFCLVNAPLSLTNEHVDALWATCVDNPCCASQRDLAFRWLEHIRVHSTAALDAAATRRLYERASALELRGATPTVYASIEYLFKWLNWSENRLLVTANSSSYTSRAAALGIDTLWQLALRAADDAVGRAVATLTQLHHSLAPDLAASSFPAPRLRRPMQRSLGAAAASASSARRRAAAGGAPRRRGGGERAELELCVSAADAAARLRRGGRGEARRRRGGGAEPTPRDGGARRPRPRHRHPRRRLELPAARRADRLEGDGGRAACSDLEGARAPRRVAARPPT